LHSQIKEGQIAYSALFFESVHNATGRHIFNCGIARNPTKPDFNLQSDIKANINSKGIKELNLKQILSRTSNITMKQQIQNSYYGPVVCDTV
jgi:hypothetical protein